MKDHIKSILREKFHLNEFRPYQEEVCLTAASGKDLLLVMPTGAGKSLCYQIPGLARNGTTLVVSPLLALIEDQVLKLQNLGFRAERINSGRDRETSRQVCVEYINGNLDFLFVAPERFAVNGFLEFLSRRKPSLIAIDEAHCISQWGHDFRPEYRKLGPRLEMLRPSPIIALTATATPQVQEDICTQLNLIQPKKFIHGFRRKNIAIEVVEMNPGERISAVESLLSDNNRLPAILYAPTRKRAEEVTAELKGRFKVATYHAGISSEKRSDVQEKFISGKLEVIVATIAFGMGIDKSNIRTVVHLALPSSIEGYYQEIGRAGRDGSDSKALLLYSYIDRKTHEFFQEKNCPEISVLEKIFKKTSHIPINTDHLADQVRLRSDDFQIALEKLWSHGGIQIDRDQNITRGNSNWHNSYRAYCEHRITQLDQILNFTKKPQCRMVQLVQYFGDEADADKNCEICDVCSGVHFFKSFIQHLDHSETLQAQQILFEVALSESIAAGTLFKNVEKVISDRNFFERIINAMALKKWIRIQDETFLKGGKSIPYRKIFITASGLDLVKSKNLILLEELEISAPPAKKSKKSSKPKSKKSSSIRDIAPEISSHVVEKLKTWRLEKARSKNVPAFRIFSDKVLYGIAETLPYDEDSLLAVHGMGPKLAAQFGQEIFSILKDLQI